jgi:hypothetical protein
MPFEVFLIVRLVGLLVFGHELFALLLEKL